MTLKQKLIDFLATEAKHLNEIYAEFEDEKPTTIRGRLNENVGNAFKRISKGVYLAVQGDTKALIIEGDTWNVIKEFEDNSIDAIITDSGYTCLNKHYEIGTAKPRNRNRSIGFQTKDIDEELLTELHRILKPGGHFFSFLPADAKDTLDYNNNFIQMSRKAGFRFNKRFIWDKIQIGLGYNGRNRYEQIIFLSKGERHMPYDLSIPDVLRHRRIDSDRRIHDAEKPIELIKDIMRFCTNKGDTVLDPFGGSMSTTFAGIALERHTVTIEIDHNMIETVINKRNQNVSLLSY
ncbi:site-specific DNA-methyltransferase [bacterium]|nr:site-specific DNA-methyltransferase [bacterium]